MRRQTPGIFEEQQRIIKKQLAQVEKQIAQLEELYLTRTKFSGNILTGFSSYILQKTLLVHSDEKPKVRRSEMLFSLSSMTSPVSRAHEEGLSEMLTTHRVTRNSVRNPRQIQPEIEQKYTMSQISISSGYQREGSLDKRSKTVQQFLPDYRSEGDNSRTLSEDSHFYSRETEDLSLSIKDSKPRKRQKKSQNESNKLLKSRRKSQSSMKVEEPPNQYRQQWRPMQAEHRAVIQSEMKAETKSQHQDDADNDSLDSIQLFMRMAKINQ